MHTKKHLSFSELRKLISSRVNKFEGTRQESKVDYCLHDCCQSAFAMMVFQDPSINAFQQRLQDIKQLNNLKTMFNVSAIPQSTQLRSAIDNIPSTEIEFAFKDFFLPLQRGKQLEQYKFINGKYLVASDGVQYFSSDKISCNCCLTKTKKDETTYYHQVVAATIICPGIKQVIPLAPEPIQNIDGNTKQDCEINAGKRIIKKINSTHPKLKIIITADSLYSKQPFIDQLKQNGMSFILVAKPTDHKLLYQWFTEFHQMGETHKLEIKDYKGQRHFYEWVNGIALNGTKDADNVNYFEYTMFKKAIKQLITTAGQLIFQSRKTILSNWLKAAGQDGRLKTKHLILLKTRDITLNTISVMGINTCRIICCFSIFLLSLRTRSWNCRILYIRNAGPSSLPGRNTGTNCAAR